MGSVASIAQVNPPDRIAAAVVGPIAAKTEEALKRRSASASHGFRKILECGGAGKNKTIRAIAENITPSRARRAIPARRYDTRRPARHAAPASSSTSVQSAAPWSRSDKSLRGTRIFMPAASRAKFTSGIFHFHSRDAAYAVLEIPRKTSARARRRHEIHRKTLIRSSLSGGRANRRDMGCRSGCLRGQQAQRAHPPREKPHGILTGEKYPRKFAQRADCMIEVGCILSSRNSTHANSMTRAPALRNSARSPSPWPAARVITIRFPNERPPRFPRTLLPARRNSRSAPASRSSCARRRPIFSASSAEPLAHRSMHSEPSAARTRASIRKVPFSIRAHAPSGTWQPPSSSASSARSAVTAARVGG